jgi:hypothetical protein
MIAETGLVDQQSVGALGFAFRFSDFGGLRHGPSQRNHAVCTG